MPDDFNHSMVSQIPKFRAFAAEARTASLSAATPELRLAYDDLARSWETLISEIEAGNSAERP